MKSVAALFVIGVLALVVQGALARTLSPPWCPDLAWLVVVGIGLRWPHFVSGVVLAVEAGLGQGRVDANPGPEDQDGEQSQAAKQGASADGKGSGRVHVLSRGRGHPDGKAAA